MALIDYIAMSAAAAVIVLRVVMLVRSNSADTRAHQA